MNGGKAGVPAAGGGSVSTGGVRWYEVLATIGVLGAGAFFMLRWGIEGVVHNRQVQDVPDLRGKSVMAALDMVSPMNLAIRKDGTEFNDSVPVGAVLRQNPPAGTKVREGKLIRVVVSQGGETGFVPNLSGLPLRNAEMLLRQNQLALGEVTESYSLRMEKGMVLSQEPKAESSVGRNSPVAVIVSGGPPPAGVILMPDFQRKNIPEATSWASENGMEIETVKDATSLFPYGVILTQQPTPDTVLSPNSKIQLTISARPVTAPGQTAARSVHYEVPQGSSDNHLRIVVVDQYGEREVFNGLRAPGSKVDVDIPNVEAGQARLKIFLNGILVEERDL